MIESLEASAKFRSDRIARYAPLLTMLASYFFLTVLMNVVFVAYDDQSATSSIGVFLISAFPVQTAGYWILLFLPFLLLPPVAIIFQRILARPARMLAAWTPEFRLCDYLVITAVCYGIVIRGMYRADAWELLASASDAISSVWARFELLDRLQFFEQAILQSVLVFLTLYSLVYALRWRKLTWLSLFAVNLIAMTVLLVSLNMKWPVVVLYGGIVACVGLYGQHRVIYATIAAVAMVCVYLLVAAMVLRIPQTSRPGPSPSPAIVLEKNVPTEKNAAGRKSAAAGKAIAEQGAVAVEKLVRAAVSSSSHLATTGLIRMALPYPYYYRTFTNDGPVCGTLWDRVLRRQNPCQPSLLVYEKMFKNDGFAGRGTAPAAFHITGYALDGWLGAIIETIFAGALIGAFMAVPVQASAVSATAVVMGILSGYFLSQLPFEAAIVYDHGVLWWLLLVLCYAGARHLFWPLDRNAAKVEEIGLADELRLP
jgi:hypothetical protein